MRQWVIISESSCQIKFVCVKSAATVFNSLFSSNLSVLYYPNYTIINNLEKKHWISCLYVLIKAQFKWEGKVNTLSWEGEMVGALWSETEQWHCDINYIVVNEQWTFSHLFINMHALLVLLAYSLVGPAGETLPSSFLKQDVEGMWTLFLKEKVLSFWVVINSAAWPWT